MHALLLANPPLDANTHPVWLPIRKRVVHIRSGDTHHCEGASRAIDLVACTAAADAHVTIHNGVHCSDECSWDECMEYTLGDHFLVAVEVQGIPSTPMTHTAVRMPH